MQPGFHSGVVTRPLSAFLRLATMGCPTLWARGAAGSLLPARVRPCWGGIAADRPPLGPRVVGGLWHRGEGAVAWCLWTPSSRAAARKRVLGRLHEVFSRTNGGISLFRAPEPSPTHFPRVSLAQAKLTVPFWRYRPATARCFWCLSTPSSRELLSALLVVVVVTGLSGHHSCVDGVEKASGDVWLDS